MQLTFLGRSYTASINTTTETDSAFSGHYRGQSVRFKTVSTPDVPQAEMPLSYRGASYIGRR
jgi:hypothetical protein